MIRRAALRCVDGFLPRSLQAAPLEIRLRARVTVIAGLVGGPAVFVALLVTTDSPPRFVRLASFALSLGFLLIPGLIRLGLPLAIGQQLLVGGMTAYAVFLAAVTGGKDTAALVTALLIPLVAILCSGPRVGLFWSLATSGGFLAVQAALALGFRAPVSPDYQAVAAWNLFAAVIAVFFSLALAASWERLRSGVEAALRMEKQRADRLHAEQRAIDQRFQSELQALVEERTRALERSAAELRRAERLASIGTLAAGVAHEINNPIGAIRISAEYALASDDHPDREAIWRAALEEGRTQALRCARIVKALLHFSAGATAARTQQDLNELVRSALVALHGTVSRDDFDRIETRLADGPIPLLADPIGIEQVVVNLVRNALEASAGGRAPVRILTSIGSAGPCLRIEDAGDGIADDDLPRIFDPFFTTRDRAGGTGLGLSIVHGIVQEHGASIDVESDRGRGTRFSVRFPCEAGAPALH
ncbi:MAG: ATP-binding protein [Myxococcota bacterium]